jgi:hypothetical protein
VAKLYKTRYFPNSSLFDSKIGHNPSYAWRCIWKARQILMLGCRWSIGSDANIRVMNDPWLRGNDGAWIPSPQVQGVYNLSVSDLMVPNIKVCLLCWYQFFGPIGITRFGMRLANREGC